MSAILFLNCSVIPQEYPNNSPPIQHFFVVSNPPKYQPLLLRHLLRPRAKDPSEVIRCPPSQSRPRTANRVFLNGTSSGTRDPFATTYLVSQRGRRPDALELQRSVLVSPFFFVFSRVSCKTNMFTDTLSYVKAFFHPTGVLIVPTLPLLYSVIRF